MEHLIFIGIVLTILSGYHYIKYKSSNYGKFEYYLNGETHPIVNWLIQIYTGILFLAFCVGVLFLGGEFIKLF